MRNTWRAEKDHHSEQGEGWIIRTFLYHIIVGIDSHGRVHLEFDLSLCIFCLYVFYPAL
ncbi:hypothetical protein CPB84DRAFT_1799567, partial [Gymnopilus junonius]